MSLPKFKGIPKGIAWLSMVGVLSLMFAAPAVATAGQTEHAQKVWVCKVVGGPGHYSLSKEGKQPIEVSVSALGSDVNPVIGAPFNDAQPSFVVARDDRTLCEAGLPPVVATPVTPTAPTSVDKCGTKDDTYTVPSTNGVDYLVGNEVVAAGTHPGTGSVTVVAKAKSGFMLNGTSTWTFGFTNVACEQPPVVVINPSGKVTVDCKGSGTATFDNSKSATQVGFELVVNGNVTLYSVSAGAVKQQSFSGAKSGSTVILQDGEANFIASAKVPKCAVVVPPTKKPATSPTPKSAPAATSVNSEKSTATVAQVATVPVGAPQTGDGSTANQSNNGLLPSLGILGFLLAFAAAGTAWAIRRRQRV